MWRWLLLPVVLLLGCGSPQPTPSAIASPAPLPTGQTIPPTFTPSAVVNQPAPAATRPPTATVDPEAETPVPFDATVVELRYSIPALALDRRLQGNVASQMLLIDETTGQGQQRSNQGATLLQLQQALEEIELEPIPDGCARCVHISYSLPLLPAAGEGWLRDPALLASIENFMTAVFGPHFPPQTILGLHRAASPYAPAHTVALTDDGTLWYWQANQDTAPEPGAVNEALPAELEAVETAVSEGAVFSDSYAVSCPGAPQEWLRLPAANGDPRLIRIACPEFALPAGLLSLYLALDTVTAANLTDNLPRPPAAFPLNALLDYQQAGGVRLTLYADETAVAVNADGAVFTGAISIGDVRTLTGQLIDAGIVQTGLATFQASDDQAEAETAISRLLVRGPAGVYDAAWPAEPPEEVAALLAEPLRNLLPAP